MKRKFGNRDTSSVPTFNGKSPVRKHLLEQQYPHVTTLRDFVLSRLPKTSRLRRKKIANLRLEQDDPIKRRLHELLETSLVCTDAPQLHEGPQQLVWSQWTSFSQKGDDSYVTLSGTDAESAAVQAEVVDFVIWLLFSREKAGSRPKHLLCEGYKQHGREGVALSTVPGLFESTRNHNVQALKAEPWPQLMTLLGQSREAMMITLLLDCALFLPVQAGHRNFQQLSGVPLSESCAPPVVSADRASARKPSEILLMRNRIFYGKPALNARGSVQPGFKHIHVLNRYAKHPRVVNSRGDMTASQQGEGKATLLLMYMFPRQFGLHNVFTSCTDRKVTSQVFHDYTCRDDEISRCFAKCEERKRPLKIPKRLRFGAKALTETLQARHETCSYTEMLRHYCPTSLDHVVRGDLASSGRGTGRYQQAATSQQIAETVRQRCITGLATPVHQVSAFCQRILSKLVPAEFWGEGQVGLHNQGVICRKVDHFISLRRFEAITLHEVVQNLKLEEVRWLQLDPSKTAKMCKSEASKKQELWYELVHFLFDSLLIPLIRNNFYVTESNTDRSHVFYFRHDVWKLVAEPAMRSLKLSMFEEVRSAEATSILAHRKLGCSQMRLLPKGTKLRPIMNLRKRTLLKGQDRVLGASVNSILTPVQVALQHERSENASMLGSTMFSISDIYRSLKSFKQQRQHPKLFFAKVDVHAAFDTIPQDAVTALMRSVLRDRDYHIAKHVEVKPRERADLERGSSGAVPVRRWQSKVVRSQQAFGDRVEQQLAPCKKNTVFIDGTLIRSHSTRELLDLLDEHVKNNLVKVGKTYYRQKRGIPQGSVLSSFLCNYFYADLERRHLSFLGPDSLLLRLTDDFLLITPSQAEAERFVRIMHDGIADYGVQISPAKSLVNFDMRISGAAIARNTGDAWFPYCGTRINCRTLDVSRDVDRTANARVFDAITIEYSRAPGRSFQRKVLSFFKYQSHLIYFDTRHNAMHTVLNSLHEGFCETARKLWAYHCGLPRAKRPRQPMVIDAIEKLIEVAYRLLTGSSRNLKYQDYSCDIRKAQVTRAAHSAFLQVLSPKQTNFGQVVAWLQHQTVEV